MGCMHEVKVTELAAEDQVNGPLASRLWGVHQQAIRTRIGCSA
jgi:hypothetical protein